MILIILSVLAGVLKSMADVLHTKFDQSWFKRCKGNSFIDPSISWKNKHKFDNMFGLSLIVAPYSDLWHLCYTLMILCLLTIAPFYHPFEYLGNFWSVAFLYGCYGVGFEITYFTLIS
jgi:hypothetical protein